MLRLALIVLASLVVLLIPARAKAQTIEHLTVVLTLEEDDTLLVEERYELSGKLERPLERTLLRESAPGLMPRRQWITDLKVSGKGVERSSHDAIDRSQVVVEKAAGNFTLRYRLHRVVPADGRFDLSLLDVGDLRVERVTSKLVLPTGVDSQEVTWEVSILGDTEDGQLFHESVEKAPLEQSIEVGATKVSPSYDLVVPPDAVKRPSLGEQLKETVSQAGLLPYLAAGFLLLSLVLRFLPIGFVIGFTRLWHLIVVVPVVLMPAPDVIYWLRHGPLDSALATLGLTLGYLGLLAGYIWLQDRGLRQARPEAFHIELALPVVISFAFPVWVNPAAVIFLPALGLPVAIYWLRDDLAMAFGAASHRIVEHVVTEGRTTLDALAKQFRIGRTRLERVLKQQPDLPLVVDYGQGTVYSQQAAAQLAELAVCANCGGATEISGMDMVACPYCGNEYAKAAAHATERPVPVIVEAFARIAVVLAVVLAFWGGAFALAFAGFEGGFGAVVLLPLVLLGGMAYGAFLLAKAWRDGKAYPLLVILLLLSGPFILPLLAFRPLSRRRVKLHFGSADTADLKKVLEERGELPLSEVATQWETSLAEATELVRFLCASGALEAVYDRPGSRLVHKRHYASIEHQGACSECGGTLGVSGGKVICHYCRAPAAA